MPTNNKRVNLTLTDEIYEKLQEFKKKNGIMSDATACLQLVVQQLRAQETTEQLTKMMQDLTTEQLQAISNSGLEYLKENLPKKE
jgi:predicted CopG family antitoxin